MRHILLVGGGTGGHIMPLLAVAEEIQKIGGVRLDYMGPRSPFLSDFEARGIKCHTVPGSKMRRYFSLANAFMPFELLAGFIAALFKLYFLMPDVIFSKGGPGALAVLFAARFYFIPIVVHESDSVPGITNRISGSFAKKVIIAFAPAGEYFKKNRVVLIGNPVRPELIENVPAPAAAKTVLGLDPNRPVVFFVGGSQGAARINQFVIENLPAFLGRFQVVHQAGAANFKEADVMSRSVLGGLPEEGKGNYKLFGFMSADEIKNAYAAADIVVSRTGASSIAEIAAFGKPAVLVPIPANVAGEHQVLNASEYAKTGAAVVLEEANLTPNMVGGTIAKILEDGNLREKMSAGARSFAKPNAAEDIAKTVLTI
ncbi:UDP-N-acetylglucosamine--N-acetylmuramyl-(pentapeptide) pyrophosphoryl-undecaprenol N-acetylglucosamine transferase [Patescibacteria group bacterium]|nr:UDP-N-acetylglucosamine--N-acetylmuramyl-(pentapeptide) pyrophosphoryl-undecaprenol N-acetylglucosamine transferase [Patescibacteria group bacterium]